MVGPPGINMKCKDKYILVMKAFYMQKKQTYKSIINDVAGRQRDKLNNTKKYIGTDLYFLELKLQEKKSQFN